MNDDLGFLQESVTKTATFSGAGYELPDNPGRTDALYARVIYSAANQASGSGVITFSVEHSDDNSTFVACASGAADKITLTTTAASGEFFIPFITGKKYIRLVATFSGGTTPTITYESQISLSAP